MTTLQGRVIIPAGSPAPDVMFRLLDLCEHFADGQGEVVWEVEKVELMYGRPNPLVRTGKDLWFYLHAHEGRIKPLNMNYRVLLEYQEAIPESWRQAPNGGNSFIGFWGSLYHIPGTRFGPGDNVVFGIEWTPRWFCKGGQWKLRFKRMANGIKDDEAVAYFKG
ncbi:MAG: hypothetical protein HYW90_02965 [Candidatus Sungbacteria bacterium]|nr:hypothetical protein [Candidatus Sungbacteria bacterium]